MTKKHNTIPFEPDEMPSHPDRPEIQRPGDPDEPGIPAEAPEQDPQELPPDHNTNPEIDDPDEFQK